MQVSNFLYWIVAKPIFSKKTLKSFFRFADNHWKWLLIRTKNIKCSHGRLSSTDVDKWLIQTLKTFNILSPTSCINIGSLHMPKWLNTRLLQLFHQHKKFLSNPSGNLVHFLCINLRICLNTRYFWFFTHFRYILFACIFSNFWKLQPFYFLLFLWRNSFALPINTK